MLLYRSDVELLAPVRTVPVPDETQLLEHIQRAIHRGWCRETLALATTLHDLRSGDVTVGLRQHLDDRAALRRPAKAALAQPICHGVPRDRE